MISWSHFVLRCCEVQNNTLSRYSAEPLRKSPMFNDLLQLNAAEFNLIEIKHWSWLDIDDFTVSTRNASFSPSSVSFFICTWPGSVFSLWFFRLQPKLMMRRALWPLTLRRELTFKRPDKDKIFLLDHSTKASQHQIKPNQWEKVILCTDVNAEYSQELKYNSYRWMWMKTHFCMYGRLDAGLCFIWVN